MSDEVDFAREAGDWTLAIGLRKLAISLAVRTALVAALEIAFVWLIEWLVAWLMQRPDFAPIAGRMAFWPNIPLGAIVGFAMAHRLCDAAGLESWWIAYAGVIAVVIGGSIAHFLVFALLTPPTIDPGAPIFYLTVAAILFSLSWHFFKNT